MEFKTGDDNITFEEFLQKQEGIYKDIKLQSKEVLKQGVKPSQKVIEGESGYLIALQHSSEVREKIESLSKQITDIVPTIFYNSANVHVTVSPYMFGAVNKPDEEVLFQLKRCVNETLLKKEFDVRIDFKELLYNQDSVILSGYPNEDFLLLSQSIIQKASLLNIDLKLPKMAHTTIARFVEEVKPDGLQTFFSLMSKLPSPGLSEMDTIVVAHFENGSSGFNLKVLEENEL